ncbi:hypothetical protein B0H14DRAFT_2566696 [Mycena olivaceomarginata]|nr:hypothetical protein B0H14DRAFT_2566696 [Mycena olivaceomarginata]
MSPRRTSLPHSILENIGFLCTDVRNAVTGHLNDQLKDWEEDILTETKILKDDYELQSTIHGVSPDVWRIVSKPSTSLSRTTANWCPACLLGALIARLQCILDEDSRRMESISTDMQSDPPPPYEGCMGYRP